MIYVYIGLQGSGKSTHSAFIADKYLKQGIKVYSNVDIKGCIKYDVYDLGRSNLFNGVLIFDEASIDMNNRAFVKKGSIVNTYEFIEFWKKVRHDGIIDCYIYSQAWDMDMTVKRLAQSMTIIKSWFFDISLLYECLPKWDFNNDGEPIIKWTIKKFPKFFYRKPYYKYFDTHEHSYKKPLTIKYFNNIMYTSNRFTIIKYKLYKFLYKVKNIHFPKLKHHFPKLRFKK